MPETKFSIMTDKQAFIIAGGLMLGTAFIGVINVSYQGYIRYQHELDQERASDRKQLHDRKVAAEMRQQNAETEEQNKIIENTAKELFASSSMEDKFESLKNGVVTIECKDKATNLTYELDTPDFSTFAQKMLSGLCKPKFIMW